MARTRWQPSGVDVGALQQEESELLGRLETVRRILRAVGVTTQSTRRGKMSGRPSRSKTRIDRIVAVLHEANKPLSIDVIYQALQAKVPGLAWSKIDTIFRTTIGRQKDGPDKIVRVGRKLYGLQQWPKAQDDIETTAQVAVSNPPDLDLPKTKLAALERILERSGEPLSIAEIHTQMKDIYPGLAWKKPAETIYAMARRSEDRIIPFSRGVWGLSKRKQEDGLEK